MKTATHFTFEVISTRSAEVACDGGNPITGHPLVYLHIKPEEGEVVCPYCSRTYRLEHSAA